MDASNRTVAYGNGVRKVFAVIARSASANENSAIVLAELEEGQPAQAIVAFFQRVIAWQSWELNRIAFIVVANEPALNI